MLLSIPAKTDSFLQFVIVILMFLFVLAITYVTVRVIGRMQGAQNNGQNIEIIETRAVSNGKYLEIVRVGEEYFLIAVGKDEVHSISKLDKESLVLKSKEEAKDQLTFASVLDKVRNLNKKDGD